MQVLPSSEKLAFSREMQQAALGFMMNKPAFCAKCVLFFKSEYFADDILGSIFNAICGYYNELKTTPSPEALSDYIKIRLKYTRDYRSAIFDCDMFKSKYPFDLISNSISDWCRTGLFKSHVELGMKYFQKQEADKFTDLMRTFLDKASEMNFSADIAYQIGDFQKDITETMNQTQSDLTTGIKEFDDALGGGFGPAFYR